MMVISLEKMNQTIQSNSSINKINNDVGVSTLQSVSSMASNEYPVYLQVWNSEEIKFYKYGIFSLIILVSFFGNSLVVITILMTNKLKKVTNYLLFNMAVADLLVTFLIMPIHLVTWFDQSIMLYQFTCKLLPFIQGMCLCCTIYTLVVIAVER